MNTVLEVSHLTKTYPKFMLRDISFQVSAGSIMGFIGRNGAGKTTTLKCLMGLVYPSGGSIRYFGMDWAEHEREIKQRIGFSGGAVDYYKRKKISEIMDVTSRFYENWDDGAYQRFLKKFDIDMEKTPAQLSEGMKVKLNLLTALCHKADLLILDEPTSGLDPVAREEIVDIFKYLRKEGASILFSTHITSDLEKCADDITYIREGQLVASEQLVDFITYRRVRGFGNTLEKIMLHYEKEALDEKLNA